MSRFANSILLSSFFDMHYLLAISLEQELHMVLSLFFKPGDAYKLSEFTITSISLKIWQTFLPKLFLPTVSVAPIISNHSRREYREFAQDCILAWVILFMSCHLHCGLLLSLFQVWPNLTSLVRFPTVIERLSYIFNARLTN